MATTQTGTSGTTTGGRTQHGTTGSTPDTAYDLISVMYHTLQGCQTYEKYAQDAEQAGQQEIAQFFRDTGRELERCAQRGQQLLAQCLQQGQMQSGRSGQLHSQMGTSGGQQSQSGSASRQHGSMSGSSGQQGSALESRSSGQSGSGSSRR